MAKKINLIDKHTTYNYDFDNNFKSEKYLLTYDNIFNELKDLLFNAISINNVSFPEQLFIKNQLVYNGFVGYDKALNSFFRITANGINNLGYPTNAVFYTENGKTYKRQLSYDGNETGAYIIYALPSKGAFIHRIQQVADELATLRVATFQNVSATASPACYAVKDEKTALSLRHAVDQKQAGESAIFVTEDIENSVKPFSISVPFVADKFDLLREKIYNEFLVKVGILSYEEKKERVQTGEINANATKAVDYLFTFIDNFNMQMQCYNLPFEMVANNSVENYFKEEKKNPEEQGKENNKND